MIPGEKELIALPLRHGAKEAACIKTDAIRFDHGFRTLCQSNQCGKYGQNWCCPPSVGSPDELKRMVLGHKYLLLWSSLGPLMDPFDAEGMDLARQRHAALSDEILLHFDRSDPGAKRLMLGAGACGRCSYCTMPEGLPCRFPNKKIFPMEACCIDVTALARGSGMRYSHGENTVTYFGGILFGQSTANRNGDLYDEPHEIMAQ